MSLNPLPGRYSYLNHNYIANVYSRHLLKVNVVNRQQYVLKNIWKNHMRFELGIARFGVQHFTSGLPVSVAAGVYDLVVYLGYHRYFSKHRGM